MERTRIATKGFVVPLLVALVGYVIFLVIISYTTFEISGVVEWSWVGAVTSTSASFRVRSPSGARREFLVSKQQDLESPVLDTFLSFSTDYDVKRVDIDTLSPNTQYFYGQKDGDQVLWRGTFTTPVLEGAAMSFRVAVAGCALTGSRNTIFNEIKNKDPFMMLHAGDMHYMDIGDDDDDARIHGFDRVLGSESQKELFTSIPLAYMWDDHDFCGNNKNSECEGTASARRSYQKGFPHYPLSNASASEEVGIYQAFTIGRVRFIMTDLRSEAVGSATTSEGKMMSDKQFTWFLSELADFNSFSFVVWVSSKPWIGPPEIAGDNWQGYSTDRQRISNAIAEMGINNLFVVSSDAHMLAFDDGSNSDYSDFKNSTAGFPLLQAGPLHNLGSLKGGPFSEGCFTYTGEINHQFAIVDVTDNGVTEPTIHIEGFRYEKGSLHSRFKKTLKPSSMMMNGSPTGECSGPALTPTSLVVVIVSAVLMLASTLFLSFGVERPVLFVSISLAVALATVVLGMGVPIIIYYADRHLSVNATGAAAVVLIQPVYVLSFVAYTKAFSGPQQNSSVEMSTSPY